MTRHLVTRHLVTRRRALAIAIIALAMVWVTQLAAILSLDTLTFRGSVVVVATTPSSSPCAVTARRGIHPGTAVALLVAGGRIVGSTQLRIGRPARDGRRCTYRFTIRDVTSGARTFVVAVGGEARRSATAAQLSRGFEVVLG